MSRQCVAIHSFLSTKPESFAKLGVLFLIFWLLCCLSHNTQNHTQSPLIWLQSSYSSLFPGLSPSSSYSKRAEKKEGTKEMKLADTHHKTELQLSVTKRRVSWVQNLTYFTHSPRLLSTWQHWPWKQWKTRLPKRFFTRCCKDISTGNSKTQSNKYDDE